MSNQTFELDSEVTEGRFVRQRSTFRDRVEGPIAGRYHLYVAPACPWSHRAILVQGRGADRQQRVG